MVLQANKPPLNFADIDQTENADGFKQYILAIHAGVIGNYEPMPKIFQTFLEQSGG
jgi:cell filamentation protein